MTPRSYFSGFQKKDVAFLHVPSRTLIEADLLFNLPSREQFSLTGSSGSFFLGNVNPSKGLHKRAVWGLGEDKEYVPLYIICSGALSLICDIPGL